ncbi:hypothetical protein CL633_04535 [bacterium]|nr:hypothetical protein [bacterium]|tara:strand:+ start:4032 stop:5063 length:1032 start_codon:yes stop_codon:yes gene_type:complete
MAITLGARITTTTQDFFLPKVVDTILNGNVFLTRMLRAAKEWRGNQIKKPVKYQKGVAGGSFSGLDTFSTEVSNTRVNLVYDPAFYEIGVNIPLTEIWTNSANSQEQVLDLIDLEIESRAQDGADELGTMAYGDGTGNSSKDLLGLEAIVDDSTNVTTIGGLSRSTYTTLQSTVTASGGTLTLAKMDTLFSAITSGSQKPSIGYTTETVWDLVGQLFTSQERINKDVQMIKGGITVGGGAVAVVYKGVPILSDEKATSGVLYLLNEDYMDFFAMSTKEGTEPVNFSSQIEGNDYKAPMGLGFSWSGWIKPSNAAALIGHLYLGGELVSWNFKRHGKLTGVTGI